MPAYGSPTPNTPSPAALLNTLTLNPVPGPTLASPGDIGWVWGILPAGQLNDFSVNAVTPENTPANGTASEPVYVGPSPGLTGVPPLVDCEIIFDANPGAINLQVQCADGDSDAEYLTGSNAAFTMTTTTQHGTKWIVTTSFNPANAPFVRLLAVTITTPTTWRVRFIRR